MYYIDYTYIYIYMYYDLGERVKGGLTKGALRFTLEGRVYCC